MHRTLAIILCAGQFLLACSSITVSKETKVVLVDSKARRVFFTATHESLIMSTGDKLPAGSEQATGLELLANLHPGESAQATLQTVKAFALALAEARALLDELERARAAIEAQRWSEVDARLLEVAPLLGQYISSNSFSRMLNNVTGGWFRRESIQSTESLTAALSLSPATPGDLRLRLAELAYASSASGNYGELDAFLAAVERVVSGALRGSSAVAGSPLPEALRIDVAVAAPSDTAVAVLPTASGTLSFNCKSPWRGKLSVRFVAIVAGEMVSDPFILVAPGEYKIISFLSIFTDPRETAQDGINRYYKCVNLELTHSGGEARRHRAGRIQVPILPNATRTELAATWETLQAPPAAHSPG